MMGHLLSSRNRHSMGQISHKGVGCITSCSIPFGSQGKILSAVTETALADEDKFTALESTEGALMLKWPLLGHFPQSQSVYRRGFH